MRANSAWAGVCQLLTLLAALLVASGGVAAPRENVIFIHHSIGREFMDPDTGAARAWLAAWNAANGTDVRLWDHDYGEGHPVWGLTNPEGVNLGYAYGEEFNNTLQVEGYRSLFCTVNGSLDSLLTNHELIAFKPGYESGWLWLRSDAELDSAKADYLEMRDFFDRHPEKTFVVVTQPPLHRLATYLDERKDRARQLANYVRSQVFLGGRSNVFTFDLFDLLATPDDPADTLSNTLRYEYEISHDIADPHPNDLANTIVGPIFARFLYVLATGGTVDVPPRTRPAALAAPAPNPFNPRTEIRVALGVAGRARLTIHDARGRLLAVLADAELPAGERAFVWDGRDRRGRAAPSGVYFVRLEAAGQRLVRKLTLAR